MGYRWGSPGPDDQRFRRVSRLLVVAALALVTVVILLGIFSLAYTLLLSAPVSPQT